MAKAKRITAKTRRMAEALNVDPKWLRTGEGSPTRRLSYAGDEAEALATVRALAPEARELWLAAGREIAACTGARAPKAA